VTLPYKQAIIPLLDFIRADAERIGAVNTVVIGADGRMEGRNTDAFGFIENLKAGVPDFDFTRGPAIVLGAGGAARAVVYALMRVGVPEIRIFNRTIKKAEMLAGCFECSHAYDWGLLGKYMADSHLLVNATSAGMAGAEDLDIDLKTLPATALVHDVVYVPLETDLLRQARLRGNPTVTGIGMLLHQARPAFQAWFGVLPEVDATLTAQVLG
jgi:shikimate dehydrogenase